jgi:hypothetical protein
MTTDELMETRLGDIILAALQRQPELDTITPSITFELKTWADSKGYSAEAVVCAVANWLGVYCDNVQPPPSQQN